MNSYDIEQTNLAKYLLVEASSYAICYQGKVKEICSNLVFCVNLGLLTLCFSVEEAPHSADLLNLLILCVITVNSALKCFDF